MMTRTFRATGLQGNMVRMVAVFLAGTVVMLDGYGEETETPTHLKRELKYLPVGDFLPVASKALALHHKVADPGKKAVKKGEAPGETDSLLIGDTLIVADSQLNNIVVSGDPEALKIIDGLLDAIDLRPRQVNVQAVLVEVDLGKDLRQGMDILRAVGAVEFKGKRLRIADLIQSGKSGPSIFDPSKIEGDEIVVGAGSENATFLDTYITALESTGNLKVMSKPCVFTANGQRAEIASGQRLILPASDRRLFGRKKPKVTTEEVGFRLGFVPFINAENEVTLETKLRYEELAEGKGARRGDPDIAVNELNTTVRLPDKGIVVLGGITRGNNKELLLFLQPRIVAENRDSDAR